MQKKKNQSPKIKIINAQNYNINNNQYEQPNNEINAQPEPVA